MSTRFTRVSERTGIAYEVTATEERTDRCWVCEGTGTEAYETQEDKAANDAAFEAWEPQGEDDYGPDDIRTGRRTCERCGGTGKGPETTAAIRINIAAHSHLITNPR